MPRTELAGARLLARAGHFDRDREINQRVKTSRSVITQKTHRLLIVLVPGFMCWCGGIRRRVSGSSARVGGGNGIRINGRGGGAAGGGGVMVGSVNGWVVMGSGSMDGWLVVLGPEDG